MSYMRLKDVPKVEDFLRSSATVPSRATIEYVRENDAYVVSRGKDWCFPPVSYQVSADYSCLLDGDRQPLNPLDGFTDVRLDQMVRENGAYINDPQHRYLLASALKDSPSLVLHSRPQHASTLLLVQRQTAQQVRDWKWPTTGYLDIAERPFQGLYMTVCALDCTQEMQNLIREVLSEREANYNAEAVAVSAMLRSRYQELQQLADELNLRLNAVRQVKGLESV